MVKIDDMDLIKTPDWTPLRVEITAEHKTRTEKLLAERRARIGDRFVADSDQVFAGHLCEVLLAERLPHCRLANSEHYDLVSFVNGRTFTLDVKAVLMNFAPQPNWIAQATAATRAKQSNALAFVSIKEDLSEAWVCGWLWRAEFFQIAGFRRAGVTEVWPSGRRFTYSADCYTVNFGRLRPFSFMQNQGVR